MPSNEARASSNAQASTSGQDHPHILPKEVNPPYDYAPAGPNDYQMDLVLHQLKSFGIQLLCSGGSGALAKTAVAPLERAKILLQVQAMNSVPEQEKFKGLLDMVRRIPREQAGFKALWRGNGANCLRLIPDVAFKFTVNDQLKIMFSPADGTAPNVSTKLAAGAVTGLMKTALFYPLDVCRTRITADVSRAGQERTYPSLSSALVRTFRAEGIMGLYRGVSVSMLGVVPYTSITFTLYDEFKQSLPTDRYSQTQLWYPLAKMLMGAGAAATAQFVLYPLDTLRRRVQMSGASGHPSSYRGALHCAYEVLRKEGFGALYRGCMVNVGKTLLGAPIQFMTYDLIKSGLQAVDPTTGVTSPL